MGKGKTLCLLGRPKEAIISWQAVVDGFGPWDDLETVENAMNYMHNPELCRKIQPQHSPQPQQTKQVCKNQLFV